MVFAVVLGACAHQSELEVAPGSLYVAMGSSFAAGPGITAPADDPPTRCARSRDNYAHQIARRRRLNLVDVSCGGATTRHVLDAWNELPAQLDAIRPETRLVTVTIGGNDLGYIGQLVMGACGNTNACPQSAPPNEQSYAALESRMNQIAREVRRRARGARLVFVEYPSVLPEHGVCNATPLTALQAENARATARRLADITARVARENGDDLFPAARLSLGHDACAAEPWMNGYPLPGHPVNGAPYHPNLAGMTAIADALEREIWGGAGPTTYGGVGSR